MPATLYLDARVQPGQVRAVKFNGNPLKIFGIPIMKPSGPFEMRDAGVGLSAGRLAEYLSREGSWHIGVERLKSLKRVLCLLDSYRYDGKIPKEARLVTLDVANQNVKAVLISKWKNNLIRLDMSSSGDYMISTTLLAVADALSYYVDRDGDKVKVRFAPGPSGESQIKVEGHKLAKLPDEVKNAIAALFDLVDAELLPNGVLYAISMKHARARMHYEHPE